MGYLTDPVVASRPATQVTKTPVALPADALTVILETNLNRKGWLIRNSGNTVIRVDCGLFDTNGQALEMAYQLTLSPGDPPYIHDLVEVIPYQALSTGAAGSLEVTELL